MGFITAPIVASMQNKANYNLAQRQIAADKANQAQQNQWNIEQWNRNNEYNTPENQVKRLQAAGINPYVSGLDGSGNSASPAQGTNPLPTAGYQAQMWSPKDADPMNDLMNWGRFQLEQQKTNAEINGLNLENMRKENVMAADISKAFSESSSAEQKALMDKSLTDFQLQNFDNALEKAKAETEGVHRQNEHLFTQIQGQNLANQAAQINLNWLDKEKAVSISEAYSRMRLNGASSKAALASAFASTELGKLYQANKKQVETLLPYMERNYEQQINLGINENKLKSKHAARYNDITDSQINATNASAAAAYTGAFNQGTQGTGNLLDFFGSPAGTVETNDNFVIKYDENGNRIGSTQQIQRREKKTPKPKSKKRGRRR